MSTPAVANGGHSVIVFDGVCVLCSAHAQFVVRHDRAGHFRMASMQSVEGAALLSRHGFDPADPATLIVVEGDRVRTDSDAILSIWQGFGGAWRLAALLRALPRPLRDIVYRWVAGHRYRIFGKRETCWVPAPADRWRFL